MADLRQLALARLRSTGLPQFAGSTVPEKLANGRAAARASLLKYVPALTFDLAAARDVMSHVNTWMSRNQDDLAAAMQSPENSLPAQLVGQMGSSDRVQQWVIANFTVAAAGMGPWQSGKVEQLVADPQSSVSENWAFEDAQARLDAFAMIVKMDGDGDLAYIFRGPGADVSGFGIAPVIVWAIAITVIGLAAVVVTYVFLSKRLEMNNALMSDLCLEAQRTGDKATVDKCIEATRDIQISTPWEGMNKSITKVALILGGAYLAIRYGVPLIIEHGGKALSGAKTQRNESIS